MKYVVVTGSSGGMGKSFIERLKKEDVFIFALDINKIEDEENVKYIKCDVTSNESVKKAFDIIKEYTNELYSIVHFAGIYMMDSLVEIDYNRFNKIFNVNVFGAYLINKTFIPLLRKGSRIIVITSELATLDPLPFTGIYAVTKSTLDKYCYSLKMELQLLDIYVSTLRAGAIKTDMLDVSTNELDKFCNKTELYTCNAERFKKIVNNVETKNISTDKLANKVFKIYNTKKPKFSYSINRNPLLKLLSFLPKRLQFKIIKKILK